MVSPPLLTTDSILLSLVIPMCFKINIQKIEKNIQLLKKLFRLRGHERKRDGHREMEEAYLVMLTLHPNGTFIAVDHKSPNAADVAGSKM